MKRENISAVFSSNLRFLMDKHKLSTAKMGHKTGVSQRMIANIANESSVPTLETVEKIAKSMGIPAWELVFSGFPRQSFGDKELQAMISNILKSSEETKKYIFKIAERESGYETTKKGEK